VLLTDAGLTPVEFRPGIDGISLIRRAYLGRPPEADQWFDKSPLNEEIDEWGREQGKNAMLVNLRKLTYCGHLSFWADKR
jgi:hypothetical protein